MTEHDTALTCESVAASSGGPTVLAGADLRFENITFAYRSTPVLKDTSAIIPAGKLTCIVGKNGCGKSTLVQVADGLLHPAAGRVLLGGVDTRTLSARERAKRLAVLFQTNGVPAATVEELVAHGRYPHVQGGALGEGDLALVEECLELLGLVEVRHRLVAELSGGQRQRAYLAMVLAQDTPVLLLDEPTASLDAHAAHEAMVLTAGLAAKGRTVGMVIHDLDLALRYADHLVVMDGGRVVAQGTREEILDADIIRRVFAMRTEPHVDSTTGKVGYLLFPE